MRPFREFECMNGMKNEVNEGIVFSVFNSAEQTKAEQTDTFTQWKLPFS